VENVGNLTSSGMDIVLSDLSEAGYSAVWFDLRASDVGAPHRRERVWIVAYPHEYGRDWGSVIAGASGEGFGVQGEAGVWGGGSGGVTGSGVEPGVVAGGFPISNSVGTRQPGAFEGSFEGSIKASGIGGAWAPESRVFPVAHGLPRSMGKRGLSRDEIESLGYETHVRDQLKGFGNAILPQIAEILWRSVQSVEGFSV
jgi:hypothetical protein